MIFHILFPRHIFPAIIRGECTRYRRGNSDNSPEYITGLDKLKRKCYSSGYPKKLVTKLINEAKTWKRDLNYKSDKIQQQNRKQICLSTFSEKLQENINWPE